MPKLKPKEQPGIKIESGIPLPSRKKPNPFVEIFAKMKEGDSFLLGGGTNEARVKSSAYAYGKSTETTYAFRQTKDGVRCWRVK